MSTIEISALRKNFDNVRALDDIDLDVADGESLVVLGPSGSGKSTLLRVIAGLEHPDAGQVRINGADQHGLPAHRRDVAIVFQHFALYPHLSALRNITLGLRHGLKLPAAEADARARDVAARLEITELLHRQPRQMSGGQRQRVALARVLARQAGIVLLDEPMSGLDAQLRQALRVEISEVLRAAGSTTLHVTHDQLDAMAMADRIAVLRDGRIEQLGTPDELYHHPATQFVATFLGTPAMNLFPATRGTDGYHTPFGHFAPTSHDRLTLGIRPENLQLTTDAPLTTEATVTLVESTGDSRIVHLQRTDNRFTLRCSNNTAVHAGDTVTLGCRPTDVLVFTGSEGRTIGTVRQLLQPNLTPSQETLP
ncbi:ABC transporter ATP-binding protein [Protofrankia symbiont of Coriaria ruscifolia]|uniref:ABC transporter ATP-binding protein n=1 Tax=Protofrankia symbiont of Coriaria ruscifolia TaxID=1306542 RepID=UPI0010417967|nr:ABC transporter ATP-binding protein [Protofrankia symbiont of Coriaria ruscifolia]